MIQINKIQFSIHKNRGIYHIFTILHWDFSKVISFHTIAFKILLLHKWRRVAAPPLYCEKEFLINDLGFRFLMSDEDRKRFFEITKYMHFLTCFSLSTTFDWSYPVFSFSLSPLFLSHWYLASVHLVIPFYLFSLTPVALTFYFSLHLFMWPFAFFARKSGVFYMPGISNAENFTFHSKLRE